MPRPNEPELRVHAEHSRLPAAASLPPNDGDDPRVRAPLHSDEDARVPLAVIREAILRTNNRYVAGSDLLHQDEAAALVGIGRR